MNLNRHRISGVQVAWPTLRLVKQRVAGEGRKTDICPDNISGHRLSDPKTQSEKCL